MASPTKLAHVVLWTTQVQDMRDWYLKVLDGRVVHQNPAGAFITYDDEHHRIAVADPVPPPVPRRSWPGHPRG